MPKAHAVSKAQLKNIIKITIGDRKKKKRKSSRRRKARRTREQEQMQLLASLSSRAPMREVKQPDPEAEQNKLMKSALLASNISVIRALNNLNKPTFTSGFAPPPFPEAPTSPEGDVEEDPDKELWESGFKPPTIDDFLSNYTPARLKKVYKEMYGISLASALKKKETIIDAFKSHNPSLEALQSAFASAIPEKDPNVTDRGLGGGSF